jgi:hypothetical protein
LLGMTRLLGMTKLPAMTRLPRAAVCTGFALAAGS